ncbi:hypothetical protein M9H77_28158 [Catharanthus roseus]|uniref:Uncharacterized protein n=1 Tax=Catharanthus roseus TaxID=4058 RepID=A0ACC0AES3_CATRO|nr:hypothetical protein M9H77_28158 [Catharanthus roseus]
MQKKIYRSNYSLCNVYLFTHCKYSEEEISKVLEKDQRIIFGEDVELEGPALEFTNKRSEKTHRKWYESIYLCARCIFARNVQKNIPNEFSSGLE